MSASNHNGRQVKTITRLVELKRRAADKAEALHSARATATQAAAQVSAEAEARYRAALGGPPDVETAADLEEHDMHVRTLRSALDRAERALILAQQEEASARRKMTDARIDLRRLETWVEREAEARTLEGRRIERIAEDEVAGRKHRVAS